MSQPTLGQNLPRFTVENGVARVVDDGDFFTQEGVSPPYRCVAILTGNTVVFGSHLGTRASVTTDFARFERGELPGAGTREQVAAFRIPLGPDTYTWLVWAGVRYVGWGDNAGVDKVEWGNYDLSNPSRVATGSLVVADTGAPPPPPPAVSDPFPWMPHLSNARDDLELAVAAYTVKKGGSAEARRVLFRQRFAMMQQVGHCTDEQRRQAHAALAPIFGWPT